MIENSSQKNYSRVVVIGIDGMPFSFISALMREGRCPNFQQLLVEGEMARMSSSLPPVSSVAWTSIVTGMNPAAHGIFGFIDRRPETLETFIPTAINRAAPALWDILARHGKRSIVLNVPCTYPPRIDNGIMAGCFLSPDLARAVHPPGYAEVLRGLGYIIDVDPWKARTDPAAFLDDLFAALEARLKTTLFLMRSEPWDMLFSHIMETDRLFHFFWELHENGHPEFAPRFDEFIDRTDDFIGEIRAALPPDAALVIMSDHGFCSVKKEVFINHALSGAGLLEYSSPEPKEFSAIAPQSVAYSMIPGRIYINLRGRERGGTVEPGAQYEEARRRVSDLLLSLSDPDSGKKIVEKIYMREEIYSGKCYGSAPDMVALPRDGYDLKGAVYSKSLFAKKEINGMHTHSDAMLYVSGRLIESPSPSVIDAAPSILGLLGISAEGLNGRNIFE